MALKDAGGEGRSAGLGTAASGRHVRRNGSAYVHAPNLTPVGALDNETEDDRRLAGRRLLGQQFGGETHAFAVGGGVRDGLVLKHEFLVRLGDDISVERHDRHLYDGT